MEPGDGPNHGLAAEIGAILDAIANPYIPLEGTQD
jgi:hypothetical protein